MNLTTHLHIVWRLRICGAIPPFLCDLCPIWNMKRTTFWDAIPCSSAQFYRRFGETASIFTVKAAGPRLFASLAYSSSSLNVGAVISSETSTRLHGVTCQKTVLNLTSLLLALSFVPHSPQTEVPFDISCHVGYSPCQTAETGTSQGRGEK